LPKQLAALLISKALERGGHPGFGVNGVMGILSSVWRVFDMDARTLTKVPDILWMRGKVPILPALLALKAYFVFDLSSLTVSSPLHAKCHAKAQHFKALESYLLKMFPELASTPNAASTVIDLATDPTLGFLKVTARGGMAFLKPAPALLLPEMLAWLRECYSDTAWTIAKFKGRWRTWARFDAQFDSILDAAESQGYIKYTSISRMPCVEFVPDRVWQEAVRYR
jgi:hypothetical protein